jgi:hypothetical protein
LKSALFVAIGSPEAVFSPLSLPFFFLRTSRSLFCSQPYSQIFSSFSQTYAQPYAQDLAQALPLGRYASLPPYFPAQTAFAFRTTISQNLRKWRCDFSVKLKEPTTKRKGAKRQGRREGALEYGKTPPQSWENGKQERFCEMPQPLRLCVK